MSSTSADDDVAAFEEWRPLLFGIAYRMLGSAADAEDIVQEACIRWLERAGPDVESVRAYLVTVVTRLCIDQLGSARVTRTTYTGPWLPEPVALDDRSSVEQADSLSLAFLVLLEELTPPERCRVPPPRRLRVRVRRDRPLDGTDPGRLPATGLAGPPADRGPPPAL